MGCALTDANGLPIKLALAPGHHQIRLNAADQLNGVPEGGMQLADTAYDSSAITSLVYSRGGWANISPQRDRRDLICFSPYYYRDWNLVERRFVNRIKYCQSVATRRERRAANFLAFVRRAAVMLWLRDCESTAEPA